MATVSAAPNGLEMSRPESPRLVSHEMANPGWPGRLHRVVRQPTSLLGAFLLLKHREEQKCVDESVGLDGAEVRAGNESMANVVSQIPAPLVCEHYRQIGGSLLAEDGDNGPLVK